MVIFLKLQFVACLIILVHMFTLFQGECEQLESEKDSILFPFTVLEIKFMSTAVHNSNIISYSQIWKD